MEEWKEYKLGDVATIQTGPFGSQLHNKDYVLKGTPIVTVEHLGERVFTSQNLPCVSDADKERLKKYTLEEGDIVFSRVGSVDRCSYVSSHEEGWLFSGRCLRVRPNSFFHPLFLYYFLQQEVVKQFIRNVAVGATMPSINTHILSEVAISAPTLLNQQKIASILSSLDDKIEVNRRINDNLEQQAQALFKSWFVDFEPFKDGEFVESELGMIPKGWRVVELEDIADISKTSINPLKQPQITFEHYSIPSFDDGMKPEIQEGADIKSNKFVIENKMTLFSKLNPRIKRVWYVDNLGDNSICSTEFVPFKAKEESKSSFLYGLVNSQGFYDYIMSMVNGATGSHQRFHPEDSLKYMFAYQEEIGVKYNEIATPIINSILNNRKESRRLAALRDTLLPRLMSGELKVNEITI